MEKPESLDQKKYVVVLAHADGWGAVSANKLIHHLHQKYPELSIHLIVSKATRSAKTGEIATKLKDLKQPRALKEDDLLTYFEKLDGLIDATPSYEEIQQKIGLTQVSLVYWDF